MSLIGHFVSIELFNWRYTRAVLDKRVLKEEITVGQAVIFYPVFFLEMSPLSMTGITI